ncbi:Putative TrmH family tRNA/rRNA methyltransferase [Candidatus Ornithobacterium hominis]|uniref:TrmH family tRNA/rRNA methyltransferase n=1 Tax=Candidatus Ornithobacterium hominis TaxID=2497989 RepID=A0A383U589_9FLAO|nr:23S rRNA (guanosine(2251)-2'-O)-methyltransferase RlmB [Candidatus Ornithobacterium hominis]MCT7905040.1 23S rRNA (guanosine(2251)-2'-O)-methyltransferase RlmB [Candidatus Ornithobacterium hominis]CAI9429777.1 23S rRNA (guanosine(2251)-2'-O)-methyltransferase RlmB [Candidatus Ornithobacterium hominis]SZD74123.1 Putative TrmH family tRNA/rRNA methyltransferase [Candidatus Ornithobacterium hominis]
MKGNKIYGINPVSEAIESGKTIDKMMVQKGLKGDSAQVLLKKARDLNIPTQYVPVQKLNRLMSGNHQGVIAFLSPIDFYSIENVLPSIYEQGKNPLFLILDRVSDVRNFGAIARTAQCCGVDAIIIPEKGAAAINEDAVKTSAGALFKIPVCRERNLAKTIEFLQLSGIQVIASSEKSEKNIYQTDLGKPLALLMGNEGEGIAPELIKKSDEVVHLPILSDMDSLNVSVACGALLYECIRQRNFT